MQLPGAEGAFDQRDDDSNDDDQQDQRSDDEFDTPVHVLKKSKKGAKGNKEKSYEEVFAVPELDSNLELFLKLPLNEIVDLEDVDAVTCDQKASLLLSKIIYPTDRKLFYQLYWGQNPLYCSRSSASESPANIVGKVFNLKELKSILKENVFVPKENILLVGKSFASQQHQESVEGPTVMKTLLNKDVRCSVTLLEPQKVSTNLWKLLSALEFEFQTNVISHVTAQTAEFTAFDKAFVEVDYDQFILQIDGSSAWDIAAASSGMQGHITVEGEESGDEEDNKGDSTADGKKVKSSQFFLAAGDTLYIPKGRMFRQTAAHATVASLFLTIGANQNRSVHNLLMLAVPQAIENLAVESARMKQTLPVNLKQFIGVAASETVDEEHPEGDSRRKNFLEYIERQVMPLITQQVMDIIDPAADQLAKSLVMRRLPVPLSSIEESATSAGLPDAVIFPYTQLRMLRPDIAVAVVEDGKIVVYHCMDNARNLYGNEISPLEFEVDDGPAIEMLLHAYPEPIMVSDLQHPSEDLEDKVGVAQALFKEGFLVIVDETSKPHVAGNDSDAESEENFNSLL